MTLHPRQLGGDEVADRRHPEREQAAARCRIDGIATRVLQHQAGKRFLQWIGGRIQLRLECRRRYVFGRDLPRPGGLEHSHDLEWAEGLRPAQLDDLIACGRLADRGRRRMRHILIRNPADRPAAVAVDPDLAVGRIEPKRRRQPHFHARSPALEAANAR